MIFKKIKDEIEALESLSKNKKLLIKVIVVLAMAFLWWDTYRYSISQKTAFKIYPKGNLSNFSCAKEKARHF